MFAIAGKIVNLDQAFADTQGTQYPPGWLRLASAEDKAAVGAVEVIYIDQPPAGADIACIRTETFDGDRTVTATYTRRANAQIYPAIVQKIKAFRDDRCRTGGYKVAIAGSDYWLQSDAISRVQQLGLKDQARDLLAAGGKMSDPIHMLGRPQVWKTLGGVFVPISAQAAFDIVAAAGAADAGNFAAAQTHMANVAAAAQPELYDWSTGWLETYVPPVAHRAAAADR
jgi:hypothetical protein